MKTKIGEIIQLVFHIYFSILEFQLLMARYWSFNMAGVTQRDGYNFEAALDTIGVNIYFS